MTGTNVIQRMQSVEMNGECGALRYRPRYLQTLNSMQSFMGFFTALLIVYGMAHSYMSSVLTSIERRFEFSSRTMGTILSINDAGIVLACMFTAHLGGRGHRPRGIFIGGCVCGFSLFLFAAAEIMFPLPSGLWKSSTDTNHDVLCLPENNTQPVYNETVCEKEADTQVGVLAVLSVAQFIMGASSTSLMILGLPFIDDNVSVDDAPIYFAVSFFGRIFGPMLGFGLGAVCNNIYFDLSTPSFKQTDPRWVAAWYIGILFTGAGMVVFSLFIGCFPSRTPTSKQTFVDSAKKLDDDSSSGISQTCDTQASWKDFFRDLRRLLINVPFMCRALSNVLDGMIITGFLSFFFKFIGQQYQLSPAIASLAGGVPTIFGIAVGVVGGGVWIKRCRLQPRHVCLMLVLSAILLCIVFLVNIALGCERTEILGLPGSESLYNQYHGYTVEFNGSYCTASEHCGCPMSQFIPVCDTKSKVNFFSPCHAGCTRTKTVEEAVYYDNCTCVKNAQEYYNDIDTDMLDGRMVGGFCSKDCPTLYIFVTVFFVAMFFLGLPLAGSIMIQYRLVDPDLKSMSTGLIALLTSALGYLPAPIFVGAIVDSTCRLWQVTSCGESKVCLLYDTDQFRWRFLLTAMCIKSVGAVLDSVVLWQMWDTKFYGAEASTTSTPATSTATSFSSFGSLATVSSKVSLNVMSQHRSLANVRSLDENNHPTAETRV